MNIGGHVHLWHHTPLQQFLVSEGAEQRWQIEPGRPLKIQGHQTQSEQNEPQQLPNWWFTACAEQERKTDAEHIDCSENRI